MRDIIWFLLINIYVCENIWVGFWDRFVLIESCLKIIVFRNFENWLYNFGLIYLVVVCVEIFK